MTTDLFSTLGGRVTCIQCNALSKRSKTRCRAPAIKGKAKCRFHGGRSTGPRTAQGRARVAAANTVHGRDTRAKRAEYRAGMVNYVSSSRPINIQIAPQLTPPPGLHPLFHNGSMPHVYILFCTNAIYRQAVRQF
jgi:hypothetical protein